MEIQRYYSDLEKYLEKGKALIIFGPRRVGKTTLLKGFLSRTSLKYRLDSGDNLATQEVLGSQNFDLILPFAQGFDLIALDEAQRISGVGLGMKILVDQLPNLRIIATGSSLFELAGQIGEPLTGRKTTITLYPVSQIELAEQYNGYDLKCKLPEWLIYGGYPEIIATDVASKKIALLDELVQSYLLKDILELERVKSSKILMDLLRLIAFQVGNQVSLSELATSLAIDYKTVARYLDLFEKSFVIYNLRGYSRNLRKEVTRKSRYYFYDNGVRNAIISNFNDIDKRNDIGVLWENFLFMERLKKRSYAGIPANPFFWRTWDQKELDLVEERDGKLFGYEFKWSAKGGKHAAAWRATYPEAEFKVITKDNYLQFIT